MNVVSLSPSERLTLSRERLRQAMQEATSPRPKEPDPRSEGFAAGWLDRLKSIPAAGLVLEAVRSWWARHPLRVPGTVAVDTATAVVQPVAQRHPLGLVLGAALVGGLFASTRPGRWLLRPAVLAGLLPQLLHLANGRRPVPSWLGILTSLVGKRSRARSGRGVGHLRPARG